jgi:hypothetical protein
MKRLALVVGSWLVLLSGCTKTPCVTSSECGSSEQCVAAQCSALSCDSVYFAVDPATGQCTPLAPCGNSDEVRSWVPCDNPCAGKSENQCISDSRCQPAYTSNLPAGSDAPAPVPCFGGADAGACGGTPVPKSFAGCSPVAQLKDPCARLDAQSCAADRRCEVQNIQCGCLAGADAGVCDCANLPGNEPTCRRKFCGELNEQDCKDRADCTTQSSPQPVFATGATTPKDEFFGCFERFNQGCSGLKEADCLRSSQCHAVGSSCFCPANASCACDGGKFLFCELSDGVRHCGGDGDCNQDERCNQDAECPAPGVAGINTSGACVGVCVPKGCKGYGETQCNNDHHCEPVYALNCSPYSGGGGPGAGGFCGGVPPGPNEGAPFPGSCTCEPTFSSCEEVGEGCDPEKSVLIRDPAILDDPFWAFPRVLGLVTGGEPSAVSDHLLAQLGTNGTVGGKVVAPRPQAKAFLDALPRRSDGLIDAARIPLQPTSLSNRLDLSDATSCGEARITYAITVGVMDRRHRMTMIIELNQPYDNAGCRTVARTWVALSKLDGAALQAALQAIYTPLLTPANLKQIRTNEFLVGDQDFSKPAAVWELRQFQLGADARMHQVLLPLSVDPSAVGTPEFTQWALAHKGDLKKGSVTYPPQSQTPAAGEDGVQLTTNTGDFELDQLVNMQTCAGCHTSATNTAFAHVAERFRGTGRAEISQFLQGELTKRALHLGAVAAGARNAVLDVRPAH